jgi:shikimate kinase
MKSKGNIVFLGMMGSGKTSIGKIVSKKLNLVFFDIDQHIEKVLKMKIAKIFFNKGEKFFREFEEKMTLDILKKKNIIIALGGGAFLNKNVQKEIMLNHKSFWLNCENETIIKRIQNSSKRPLAFNLPKHELIKLIKKRSNIYSKALYKIDCNNLSKNEIVKKILNIYETDTFNS